MGEATAVQTQRAQIARPRLNFCRATALPDSGGAHWRIAMLAVCLALAPSLADAKMGPKIGKCVLQVKQKTYLNGPCEIAITDKAGSFTIGVSETRPSPYFAYVSIDADGATGFWNETPDASHAHTSLGKLTRDRACWKNKTTRICAYK
jgi:hypothetical protein